MEQRSKFEGALFPLFPTHEAEKHNDVEKLAMVHQAISHTLEGARVVSNIFGGHPQDILRERQRDVVFFITTTYGTKQETALKEVGLAEAAILQLVTLAVKENIASEASMQRVTRTLIGNFRSSTLRTDDSLRFVTILYAKARSLLFWSVTGDTFFRRGRSGDELPEEFNNQLVDTSAQTVLEEVEFNEAANSLSAIAKEMLRLALEEGLGEREIAEQVLAQYGKERYDATREEIRHAFFADSSSSVSLSTGDEEDNASPMGYTPIVEVLSRFRQGLAALPQKVGLLEIVGALQESYQVPGEILPQEQYQQLISLLYKLGIIFGDEPLPTFYANQAYSPESFSHYLQAGLTRILGVFSIQQRQSGGGIKDLLPFVKEQIRAHGHDERITIPVYLQEVRRQLQEVLTENWDENPLILTALNIRNKALFSLLQRFLANEELNAIFPSNNRQQTTANIFLRRCLLNLKRLEKGTLHDGNVAINLLHTLEQVGGVRLEFLSALTLQQYRAVEALLEYIRTNKYFSTSGLMKEIGTGSSDLSKQFPFIQQALSTFSPNSFKVGQLLKIARYIASQGREAISNQEMGGLLEVSKQRLFQFEQGQDIYIPQFERYLNALGFLPFSKANFSYWQLVLADRVRTRGGMNPFGDIGGDDIDLFLRRTQEVYDQLDPRMTFWDYIASLGKRVTMYVYTEGRYKVFPEALLAAFTEKELDPEEAYIALMFATTNRNLR